MPRAGASAAKALSLPFRAPGTQSMPINSVDSYSGVLELAGTCARPGSSGCPMGGFLGLLGKLPPGPRWLGLSPQKTPTKGRGLRVSVSCLTNWGTRMGSEQAEGEGFIDGHGGANAEIDRKHGAEEEGGHGHRTAEGVLELVEAFDERDQHQTQGDHGLQGDA